MHPTKAAARWAACRSTAGRRASSRACAARRSASSEYPLLLLGIAASERKRKTLETLDRVGLLDFARRLPDALSGGQRQRVAIARALVKSPAIVIADEPTGNLDSATAAQIVALLRELTHERGAAAVVATHDDRMTAYCDRVLRLADGVLQ